MIDEDANVTPLPLDLEAPLPAKLQPFVESTRRHLGMLRDRRREREIPPARRRIHYYVVVAAAVAAVVIGWWVLGSVLGLGGAAKRVASQAEHSMQEDAPGQARVLSTPAGKSFETHRATSTREGEAPAPAPSEPAKDPAPVGMEDEELPEVHDSTVTDSNKDDVKLPSVQELERAAQAAWAAGKLTRAEELLSEIIRRQPRSHRAELAYGDLFSIANQQNSRTKELRLWKEYLRRFPQGQFADTVKASICRRTADVDCWGEYLANQKYFTYRSEALRAVERRLGG
jgi:hypothetical protein